MWTRSLSRDEWVKCIGRRDRGPIEACVAMTQNEKRAYLGDAQVVEKYAGFDALLGKERCGCKQKNRQGDEGELAHARLGCEWQRGSCWEMRERASK